MAPNNPGSTNKTPSMLTVGVEAAAALALVVYAFFGIVYFSSDGDVIKHCHASNGDVHILWPFMCLWVYVLISIVCACVIAMWLVVMAVLKRPATSTVWEDSEPLDWKLLWGGFILSGMGILMAVLGYWGYAEVYVANPWCDSKAVVFEELNLARFARVTLWLQFVAAVCFILGGWLCWSLPFMFELKKIFTEELESDTGRGSRTGPGRGTPLRGKNNPQSGKAAV